MIKEDNSAGCLVVAASRVQDHQTVRRHTQQLEERGIDSAIYSSYILSLLHRQPVDLTDLPPSKGRKRSSKSCQLEEFDQKAASFDINEQAVDLDHLVDELCEKLREAASANEGDKGCLKEKNNSEEIFKIERPLLPDSSKCFSDLTPLPKDIQAVINYWARAPQSVNRARTRRRGNSESSPKVTKRKDNKENVCGVMRGRMRSRSTVKQSGCASHRMRSSAKSLDRNDDEAVVRFVKGEMRGRKHLFGDEREAKLSRTPGRKEKIELPEFDKDLPMDFQQLLQSPDDSSFFRQPKQSQHSLNFIQCGTNITSSIWSDTSEKMDEDEVPLPWEATSKWSEARSSILSSAWKLPFVYEKDVESTSLALANDGSFFSFFGASTLLNHNKNSSFTEVTPGAHIEKKKVQVAQPQPDIQEEDLLTSMKTHFRPIKDEGFKLGYKDGSSFAIATNFEPVKYRRSESGALYLGSNNKYFEFKRRNDTSEFVPKFKVCKTEKFCQTEDIPSEPEDKSMTAEADTEEEDELSQAAGQEEFYFPGDDQLAEEMLNGSEEEDAAQPCIQVSGWVTTWPVSAAIWSNDTLNNNNNTWMLGGVTKQKAKNSFLISAPSISSWTRIAWTTQTLRLNFKLISITSNHVLSSMGIKRTNHFSERPRQKSGNETPDG
ncbi:hypothetical protein GE061_007087 [Apolygus lucorum]|uniref:Uncharacterized protein n=1 Tax=Apolygus lucorum TaxID=248454 RepID=A0A8S9WQQ7_APOLU|nr:hypothetical protein GE061_007087 [Apolygus lucorum]